MIPKFRAYSTEENEMYYPHNDENVDWIIDDETGFIAPLVNLGSGMWGMIDKYVLMQSTGLKDKNGVEIFEGDIVKTLGADLEVTFSTIKFEEGAFCVDYKDLGTEFVFLYFVDSPLEVIGNIYENSELLEEQR
ncbi:YopX family protein [Enterococcus hirae]